MHWRQVDRYHMRSGYGHGNYYISKAFVSGVPKYILWTVRRDVAEDQTVTYTDIRLGVFADLASAQRMATRLSTGVMADSGLGSAGADCVGATAGG